VIGGLQTCPVITAGLHYNGLKQVIGGGVGSVADQRVIDRRSPEEEGVEGLRGGDVIGFRGAREQQPFHTQTVMTRFNRFLTIISIVNPATFLYYYYFF